MIRYTLCQINKFIDPIGAFPFEQTITTQAVYQLPVLAFHNFGCQFVEEELASFGAVFDHVVLILN
jgi:hypothetical protein